MDLILQLSTQRHAVRLLQLFYLQHSRENARFATYDEDDDGGGGGAAAKRTTRRRRRPRRQMAAEGGGDAAEAEDASSEEEQPEGDARSADPFYRMVGDTSALDGEVRVFPGVWEDEGEGGGGGEQGTGGGGAAAEDAAAAAAEARGQGGGGGASAKDGAAAAPSASRLGRSRRRRLVFARAAVEMGPCTNRQGPAALYLSGVTVPPLVVQAWLKRSYVGRQVRRAFFFPRQPPSGEGGRAGDDSGGGAAAAAAAVACACAPDGACVWGGMAGTAQQAAAAAWAQAGRCAAAWGLDGVRIACSDRALQAEVLAALDHEDGEAQGQEMEKGEAGQQHKGGAQGGGNSGGIPRPNKPHPPLPPPPLRLEPTASATHALCVARVSVADLRAAGSPLPPGDDGAPDPSAAARASERALALRARRGQVSAADAAEAASLAAPHRYAWSLMPTAWLYRLAWDEPATHGRTTGGTAGPAAAACAHAVHKLDEALRVLGLAGDGGGGGGGAGDGGGTGGGGGGGGGGGEDGRAARSDVTPEEREAWAGYERAMVREEAAGAAACEADAGAAGAGAGDGAREERGARPRRLRLRRALDVGAAPGSWTALMARRILSEARREREGKKEAGGGGGRGGGDGEGGENDDNGGEEEERRCCRGMVVVAVDPADLDPSCLELPIVKHLRVRAGTEEAARQIREALRVSTREHEHGKGRDRSARTENEEGATSVSVATASTAAAVQEEQVDLLTCDANTHPRETLRNLVVPLLPHLKPGGWLVVTLKLHGSGRQRGHASAECARDLRSDGKGGAGRGSGGVGEGGGCMLPGAVLWLMANTTHERTFVARKREDWVD